MAKKIRIEKTELLKAIKRATAPGTFPGQNRARRFRDRKKEADRRACRKKVQW